MEDIVDAKEKINWKMFFFTLFLGWFGVEKFYYGGGKAWKLFLVKLGFMVIFLGIFWNIFDLIMILRGKYQNDAREYFN